MLWSSAYVVHVIKVCARWEHVLSTAPMGRAYADRVSRERAREVFDEIAADYLVRDGVDLGRIFSATGLRVRGKAFAFPIAGGLLAKLPEDRVTQLEAEGRGERMVMRGRAMREWILVDNGELDLWPDVIEEALAFVDGITP